MKRILTIILIVLLVTGIILLGMWYFGRKSAVKKGQEAPTFRQFLSGETTADLQPSTPGNLSSVFVDTNLTNPADESGTPTIGTQSAVFTGNSTILNTNNTSQNAGVGAPSNPSSPTTGVGAPSTTQNNSVVTVDPTTVTPVSVSPVVTGPECTDADLNIQFHADDLAKLNALQNRFYAISQVLHTDADVAVETGNHDNFAAKVAEINGLYTQCRQYTVASANTNTAAHGTISDPVYQKRVPTPFWHDAAQDSEVFIATPGSYDGVLTILPTALMETLVNPATFNTFITTQTGCSGNPGQGCTPANASLLFALRTLERSLRLNIW